MDRYVADPHWGILITGYFYLGGIAAGSYALAELAALFGGEADRRATRGAHYLAFPLVCVCGFLLVVDLGRPERFWHMLIQSETFRPMFKWWSPMSAGSWALSAFGAFSFVSFVQALADDGRLGLGRWRGRLDVLRRGWAGRLIQLGGIASALFLGSYTGVLLTASNQPIWANTTWLGALFLASAASTGAAAVILLARWRRPDVPGDALERVEQADAWAMALELAMLAAVAWSLGSLTIPAVRQWPGVLVPAFVIPFGLLLPLLLHLLLGPRGATASAVLVLIGGFALRAAIVGMPVPLLGPHS